jgi:hypothetical protein
VLGAARRKRPRVLTATVITSTPRAGSTQEVIDYDQNVLRDTAPDGEGTGFPNRFRAVPLVPPPGNRDDLEVPISDQTKQITIPTFQIDGAHQSPHTLAGHSPAAHD